MLKTMSSTVYLLNDLKNKVNVIPDGKIDNLGFNLDELSYKSNTSNLYDYINEYYINVLKGLNIDDLSIDLMFDILLSNDELVPNRLLISSYIDLLLGTCSYDIDIKGNKPVYNKVPSYIVNALERTIKDNNDLNGYNSVRAYYLYLKSLDYLKYKDVDKDNELFYLSMYKSTLEKSNAVEDKYIKSKIKVLK